MTTTLLQRRSFKVAYHCSDAAVAVVVAADIADDCCYCQIQLLEPTGHGSDDGEQKVVLHNGDWQFCKLVEHLDHAFLHG